MFARIEKLVRVTRWRLAPAHCLPLWWHVGRPNFGDDINPTFFGMVSGQCTRFASDRRRPHLLGAGSILERAVPASVVCGSGLLQPPRGQIRPEPTLVAVRGERSLAAFAPRGDVFLGDPVILVDAWVARGEIRHRFGLVPHVRSVPRWRQLNSRSLHLIDPGLPPWQVVEEIAACETVLSQSLHGLIVADALGVPNVWVAPSSDMVGDRFKFDDYFSTLDAAKECVPENRDVFDAPGSFAAGIGCYRYSKAEYRAVLGRACAEFAARSAAA
ncbi:MAG: polysaccharide pyruvyl transferase family protein [Planctomycetaceae bacterium]